MPPGTRVSASERKQTFRDCLVNASFVPGPVFRQCCGQRECTVGFDAPTMDFERPVWRRQLPFRKRARHGLKAPLYNNVIALLKIDRTGNVSAPEPSYEIHTVNIDGDGLSIGGFDRAPNPG